MNYFFFKNELIFSLFKCLLIVLVLQGASTRDLKNFDVDEVFFFTWRTIFLLNCGDNFSGFCYAALCPAGLQGAFRSHQVHLLTQGTDVGCGLPTLFNVTDITNSLAEPHFKATRWVIGELLKVNTANWPAFPLRYKVFDKYNTSTAKEDSELPCLG